MSWPSSAYEIRSVRECVQHGLLKAFEVLEVGTASDLTAAFTITCKDRELGTCCGIQLTQSRICSYTVAVTKTGVSRLSLPPAWYSAEKVKSSVEIQNADTKALLTKSLKPTKKKVEKKE